MKTFSVNSARSANSAKRSDTRKSTFQLVLGLTFLLVYATTTQMQADSSEHAVQVVEAHLSAGDAAIEQMAFQGVSTNQTNSAAAQDLTKSKETGRHDFNQDGSARVAASLQMDEKVDADEIELQSESFSQQLEASLSHMDENIDALITDMLSLQNQIRQSEQAMIAVKPKSKNYELAHAMSALIEQAAHQKAVASNAGNFQSFAQAEQKVIKLHAQATRLASIRD